MNQVCGMEYTSQFIFSLFSLDKIYTEAKMDVKINKYRKALRK